MVSIVIPIFNAEQVLSRCVESFLNQTSSDFELILVDDGSTDGSLAICRNYENRDARIHVLAQPNQGASAARNTGILAAQGDFLMFADADDYVKPETLSTLLLKQKESNADFLIFGYESIFQHHTDKISFPSLSIPSLDALEPDFPKLFLQYAFHSLCNKLYRREKIQQQFNVEISLGEDLTFNLAYLQHCSNIVFLPDVFYCYTHENSASLTQKYRDDKFEIALYCYHIACEFSKAAFSSSYLPRAENSLLLGDVTRCIQRLIWATSCYDKKCRQKIHTWLSHPEVKAASKKMERPTLVFWGLWIIYRFHLAFLLPIVFRIQQQILLLKKEGI